MIVRSLDVSWTIARPTKANAPLVVDPDRMLAFPIPLQCFEPIGRRDAQVTQPFSGIESFKLTTGNVKYLDREALGALTVEYCLRALALEAPDQCAAPASAGWYPSQILKSNA
jgi:hypothetical protein